MASRRASISRTSKPLVHLSCGQCNSQLGTFENEWIRLTSTYARARHNGRHMGTEIGNKVQRVPAGVTQKAAEGCAMAEIFCKECSNLVGQYCKGVPNVEKQHLVNNYFYKLSRTYLSDPQTSERVDPIFGYEGDLAMPPPQPRPSVRPSVRPSARQRMSVRPSVSYTPRDSLCTFPERDAGYRQSVSRNSFVEMREDSIVAEQLQHMEQRLTNYESELFRQSRAVTPMTGFGYYSHNGSEERSFSQPTVEPDSAIEVQRKQITALTKQVEVLNDTIQDLKGLLQEARIPKQDQQPTPVAFLTHAGTPDSISNFEAMIATMRNVHGQESEAAKLRKENKQLKSKFAKIETAMGMKPGAFSGLGDSNSDESTSNKVDDSSEQQAVNAHVPLQFHESAATGTQLLTPTASQQPSVSSQDAAPNRLSQQLSDDSWDPPEGPPADATAGEGHEQVEGVLGSPDEMQVDGGYLQVWGDDDLNDMTTAEPQNSTRQGSREAGSTSDLAEAGVTGFPRRRIYPGQPPAQLGALRATSTNSQTTPDFQELALSDAVEGDELPANQPLFGVIKPVSKKSIKRVKNKDQPETVTHTQIQIQTEEQQVPMTSVSRPLGPELVEFSDDEYSAPLGVAGPSQQPASTTAMHLHYGRGRDDPPAAPGVSPWTNQTTVPFAPSLNTGAMSLLGSSSRPGSAESCFQEIEIDITRPEDVRQRLEREESGIREPREKKIPVQTTEKLLNEELMELGLGHWIGKEKKTKEYRDAIDRARAEKRERNKQEALAKAGIINPRVSAMPPPPAAPVPKKRSTAQSCRPPRKYNTLQSLRRRHNRPPKTPKVLADVTNQQNTQKCKATRKRKADAIEEAENQGADVSPKAADKETKQRSKKASGRKSKRFLPAPETAADSLADGVKTRRQIREAEIEKLDRLAQEAMEVEEAA